MKISPVPFVNSLLFCLVLCTVRQQASAQVSIPVVSAPNPTCVDQMYSDILWPSGYTPNQNYDPNGPTNFANSNEGVLGLTIYFEVRPYGYESVYDSSSYGAGGTQVMASVAATAINRSRTNNVDVTNAPGDPWIILAAKDMSSSIWTVNKQGTGGLKSSFYNSLVSILNGAPNTQNCNGLMYSWAMAIAASNAQNNGTLRQPQTATPTNIFMGTLFFNSNNTVPSVSNAEKPYLSELGIANAPGYPSGYFPWYFWTITNAQTFGNFPAMLY